MNIKIGKKFILGEQSNINSPNNLRAATLSNRGIQSPLHKTNSLEIPAYIQPPTDPISSMPVRDQITKLENMLHDFEEDLKQSKKDMDGVKNVFSTIESKFNKEMESVLDEISIRVKETGDKLHIIQQASNELTDLQLADVLTLRGQYDESVKVAKALEHKTSILENDVGFKIVYKF